MGLWKIWRSILRTHFGGKVEDYQVELKWDWEAKGTSSWKEKRITRRLLLTKVITRPLKKMALWMLLCDRRQLMFVRILIVMIVTDRPTLQIMIVSVPTIQFSKPQSELFICVTSSSCIGEILLQKYDEHWTVKLKLKLVSPTPSWIRRNRLQLKAVLWLVALCGLPQKKVFHWPLPGNCFPFESSA